MNEAPQLMDIGLLRPNEHNPRTIDDGSFKKLVLSLLEFPEMMHLRPIVVDEDYIILGGNMRHRAAIEAGWTQIPVIVATGLTEEQKREFVIKDNVSGGEWDYEVLAAEWNTGQLSDWGLDLPSFDDPEPAEPLESTESTAEESGLREEYSAKIGEVIYEPKETSHTISDLFTRETKFDADIDAIQNPELREMLRARAAYFSLFNYGRIADYYAYQATADEQSIFERLALVLLDKDQLIENGFSKVINEFAQENGFND